MHCLLAYDLHQRTLGSPNHDLLPCLPVGASAPLLPAPDRAKGRRKTAELLALVRRNASNGGA